MEVLIDMKVILLPHSIYSKSPATSSQPLWKAIMDKDKDIDGNIYCLSRAGYCAKYHVCIHAYMWYVYPDVCT